MPSEASRLRRLLREAGPRRAAQLTGLPESTLARLAAEMLVRRASAIVVRQALRRFRGSPED